MEEPVNETVDRVWVVVLNWNNGTDTASCLSALAGLVDPSVVGVLICDNASSDDSLPLLRSWAMPASINWTELGSRTCAMPVSQAGQALFEAMRRAADGMPFVLIHTGGNLGFAGGNNVGLRVLLASGVPFDAVLILNNDAWPVDHAVRAMAARLRLDSTMGMCGPTVVFAADGRTVQARAGCRFNALLARAGHIGEFTSIDDAADAAEVERELHYILGAALMVSRRCLEDVGLMHEGYFLYYEEIDWCLRARRRGWRLGYVPGAVVMHKGGGTIGSSHVRARRSLLSEYYLVRSALRFTGRFYPWYLPTVMIFHALKTLREALAGDWQRVIVRLRALLGLAGPGRPAEG